MSPYLQTSIADVHVAIVNRHQMLRQCTAMQGYFESYSKGFWQLLSQ